MLQTITTTRDMNKELEFLCGANGLQFDCGCSGNILSTIAVVAEAPGEREVAQKAPLIGQSGNLLFTELRKQGLTRVNLYLTNVVKRKINSPAGQARGKLKAPVSKQEIQAWKDILYQELALLPNLKYVLILGNYALSALMDETGIGKWRGSVVTRNFQGRDVTFVCAYNPAAVLHEPSQELIFRMDIDKLRRAVAGTIVQPEIKYILNPSFDDARAYIQSVTEAGEAGELTAYDIEGMAGETCCIGFAYKVEEGICINFRSQGNNRYTVEEERIIRLDIQRLLANKKIKFVAQNANFDMTWLWFKDRIRVHATYCDIMLAHHTLYPSLPHNLGFIVSQYTDMPYYKDDGVDWKIENDVDEFWRYNIKDCVHLLMIYPKIMKELKDQGLYDFFFNHVMRLQPHLVRMTVNGIKADEEYKEKLIEQLDRELEDAKRLCNEQARECIGDSSYSFNPNSPRQVGDLFFSRLKLVGRGTSTNKENRDRILKHPRTPESAKELIRRIDDFAEKQKFFSTYAKSRLDSDGRFRCEYRQTGVQSAPGRLSSAATMWGNGLNLQNIPDAAKIMFTADEGYVLVYFDKAQIEARIVAVEARIEKWKEQFETARLNPGTYDAHCALASEMFKIPYDQVPKSDVDEHGNKTIRFTAKRCRHGLNYRMQPDRLATTTGMSLIEATRNHTIYHRTTPEIKLWWASLVDEVKKNGQLWSAMGRRWILLEKFDEGALDSIVAFKPQSAAGDLVASIIYKSHEDPRWPYDAAVILNVHDALIAMCRPSDVQIVRDIFDTYNNEPLVFKDKDNYPLITPADYAISQPDDTGTHRWSTLKKVK